MKMTLAGLVIALFACGCMTDEERARRQAYLESITAPLPADDNRYDAEEDHYYNNISPHATFFHDNMTW